MDRHEPSGSTAEETAANHAADLMIAADYEVNFLSYWHDDDTGLVFCFVKAPDEASVEAVHAASHGAIPSEVIEVSEGDVVRFLGRVSDPKDASEITSAFRTICFTDLVGSTELLDSLGQSQYMVLLTEHDLIVRKALMRWDGREVKHTGDGLMAAFDEVGSALSWSLDLLSEFGEHEQLVVRIGIAAGEPVDSGGDLFGSSVTLASRICDSTAADTVATSALVRDLGVRMGFRFDDGAEVELKGFAETAHVFQLLGDSRSGSG